jgi:hypothetical protein
LREDYKENNGKTNNLLENKIRKNFWSPRSNSAKSGDIVEMEIRSITAVKYHLFNINPQIRPFFPAYKQDFVLQTNVGKIVSRVTSSTKIVKKDEPWAGDRIQGGLKDWFIKKP